MSSDLCALGDYKVIGSVVVRKSPRSNCHSKQQSHERGIQQVTHKTRGHMFKSVQIAFGISNL